MMKRLAAHKITFRGVTFPMSIATLSPDGTTVTIAPLTREVHSTIFINGHIEVWAENATLHYRTLP